MNNLQTTEASKETDEIPKYQMAIWNFQNFEREIDRQINKQARPQVMMKKLNNSNRNDWLLDTGVHVHCVNSLNRLQPGTVTYLDNKIEIYTAGGSIFTTVIGTAVLPLIGENESINNIYLEKALLRESL